MLIVIESELLRKIVSSYALAELSDVIAEEAVSFRSGMEKLAIKQYDVVLATAELNEGSGRELFEGMKLLEANATTPFVLITSTHSPDEDRRLDEAGIDYRLRAPYTSVDLARVVNEATQPRAKRIHDRYAIPKTLALIQVKDLSVTANAINFSREGVLCELTYRDDLARPLRPNRLEIIFPEEYGGRRAEDLIGIVLRFEVMTWTADHVPEFVRVAWRFIEIPDPALEILDDVLDRVDQEFSLAGEPKE